MPSRPPGLKAKPKAQPSRWSGASRHDRGYGYQHVKMRERVLVEEPCCYLCLAKTPPIYTPSTIAEHKVPKAEGGTDDRDNYGGACDECARAKTLDEAARARGAKAPRPRRRAPTGPDGWPL